LWGSVGASVAYGATLPGPGYGAGAALLGEAATTFALVALLFLFVGHSMLKPYTPLVFPVLYAVMVYLEAPLSGTSTNPARSLGPEVLAGSWSAWWIYWIGPAAGALAAVALHRIGWIERRLEIDVAKLYHFEHDPHGVFGVWRKRQAR
jgi:aquaporin Z